MTTNLMSPLLSMKNLFLSLHWRSNALTTTAVVGPIYGSIGYVVLLIIVFMRFDRTWVPRSLWQCSLSCLAVAGVTTFGKISASCMTIWWLVFPRLTYFVTLESFAPCLSMNMQGLHSGSSWRLSIYSRLFSNIDFMFGSIAQHVIPVPRPSHEHLIPRDPNAMAIMVMRWVVAGYSDTNLHFVLSIISHITTTHHFLKPNCHSSGP